MCRSRLSAIGERTLFSPHANSTACGLRARGAGSTRLDFSETAHDLIRKPVPTLRWRGPPGRDHAFTFAHDLVRKRAPTFRHHALALPVQHADQREQPAGGFEVDPHLVLQSILQGTRPVVMNAAAAHIDGFDLVRRRGADRLIVTVADHEIVLHYPPE